GRIPDASGTDNAFHTSGHSGSGFLAHARGCAPRRKPVNMLQRGTLKDFDWAMLFIIMTICGIGVVQIFSATHDTVWQGAWWKQLIYIVGGIFLMWVVTNLDYHALMLRVYPMYIASVVLLVAVLLI